MSWKVKLTRALVYPIAWPVLSMPGKSYQGPLGSLTFSDMKVRSQLLQVVTKLAGEIGERHAGNYAGLQAAERFIKDELSALGYTMSSQTFKHEGVDMQNVIAERKGTTRPQEIIVVGAHYDTVYGSPGADDNASGVAAMLAIARLLRSRSGGRTVRFVAFANEENQHSTDWGAMGSYHYARQCHEQGENIVGMISLEMLGVYFDKPGSQQYPSPFNLFFPDTGNFIAFVGNLSSRRWVRQCIGSFRTHCRFPSEGAAVPERFRDIARSDHWSFWQFGYEGLMITDTSNFRNRLYHTLQDTPATLDFDRLTRLTIGLSEMIATLAK